ncbi:MAG: Spy/CpxP family protein refolding chaperone [Draconibacterium sp.]
MKTSKLTKLAWVFFALAVTSTTLYAQGWRNGKQPGNGRNNYCVNQILGLNDDQKAKIDGLNEMHQTKMGELRTQRQSTTDAIEKSEIRTTMLKIVKAHRDEVKSLLTAEQQKEYDLLQTRGNYGKGRGNANFQGRGQGKGNCQFAGDYRNRGNRNGGGQGYGNRRNQNCFRN